MDFQRLFKRSSTLKKNDNKLSVDKGYILNPLSTEFVNNPYPILDYLRKNDPVHRCTTGAWVLTRYSDVSSALSDNRLKNSPAPYAVVNKRNAHKYLCAEVANNIIPFLDDDVHKRIRFILGRSFFQATKSFQGQEGKLQVEAIAEDILKPLLQQTEFDVIHEFGTLFSGRVMCWFMGFADQDLAKLTKWSEMFLYIFSSMPNEDIRNQVDKALSEFRIYLRDVLHSKTERPQSDWVSALIQDNQTAEKPLCEEQLIDTFMLFFADGLENVDRFIGTVFKLLLEHPSQLVKIRSNMSLIDDFIEECFRFDTPAQFIGRIAQEDIELHGQTIKANSAVYLMLGSANRDPDKYPDPDVFSLEHGYKNILTFGRNQHSCFGKHLVKIQIEAALKVILKNAPNLTLQTQTFQWEPRLAHRWLVECRLRVK